MNSRSEGRSVVRRRSTGSIRTRAGLILAVLLLFPALGAGALSVSSLDARTGLIWLQSYGGGQVIAPSPLMTSWGFAPTISFNQSLSLVPGVELFGTQYQLLGGRPIPTEIEYAQQVWVLSVMIDPALRYTLHLSKTLAWGVSLSPAVVLKIPTVRWDMTAQQVSSVIDYFYAQGRYFYPGVATFVDWQLAPTIALEGRLRGLFPVFHLWDGDGLPFYDQLMVGGSISLRFSLAR